jgi:hypothetical protein
MCVLQTEMTAAMRLASAAYRWDPDRQTFVAEALEVLTLDGSLVKEMTAFMMPELFPRFGLPDEIGPRTT